MATAYTLAELDTDIWIQLLCHGASRHRSSPPAHLKTAGKTVHPILSLPNPCMLPVCISRTQLIPFSVASSMSTLQVWSIET